VAKRKRKAAKPKPRAAAPRGKKKAHAETPAAMAVDVDEPAFEPFPDTQIATSNLLLHDLFAQQTRQMLERADLDEEQKQSILIGMSCPCCGAGGFSFTAKLKRRT
jgi:hypothetical protein